jgi:SAM-dependent methyltransferase
MRPPDLASLKDDLLNFRAELEEAGRRAELIETGLPRLLNVLELIPDAMRGGDVLELGSSPYFLSLCLHRLCSGRLRLGNYFGTKDRRGSDRLVHQRTGEVVQFDYDLFNIETDEFPHPDASFDLVIFSELIEHLVVNPVWTLSEIHRVLRPNGCVIITTPNKLSLERLATFVRGGSQMVDRYSPLFGYGGRHNREYGPAELCDLLTGCGFTVEAMALRDLVALPRNERWQRALWKRWLALYSDAPRAEHIFLRARRGERFRWHFPPDLFDNMQFFTLVRHAWMEMGINDSIQTADGWYDLERGGPDGRALRWTRGERGQAFLKTPAAATRVGLEVYAAPAPGAPPASLRLVVWDRWLGRVQAQNVYVDAVRPVERGRWQTLEFPIGPNHPNPGDEVEVMIHPGASETSSLPERERGVAVHRVWYEEERA